VTLGKTLFFFFWFTYLPHPEESRLSDLEIRLAYVLRFDIDPYLDLQMDGYS
jgi:hypothetical protein